VEIGLQSTACLTNTPAHRSTAHRCEGEAPVGALEHRQRQFAKHRSSLNKPRVLRRLLRAAFAASLFALVLGLKLVVIDRFGSDLPEWDQWDAEGLYLLAPWSEHRLTPADLFTPHNEHRVVLTKLLALAGVWANGQWDRRLQCVVNAGLHSALAALVFLFGCRGLEQRWLVPWFVLVAAAGGLPLAWENVVCGFHSQQYFLLATAVAAIVLLPPAKPWSRAWWMGAVCAGLALLSMGSGLLAPAAVLAVVALRWWHREMAWRDALPALVVCAALVACGLLIRVAVPYHEEMKARDAADFLRYVWHSLQWPAATLGALAGVLWLPWIGLSLRLAARQPAPGVRDFGRAVWGLGAWVLLQVCAAAYARGAGGGLPAPRYLDTLAMGLLANGLALAWLWHTAAPGMRQRLALAAVTGAWTLATVHGLTTSLVDTLANDLPPIRNYYRASERNVRNYLATGDAGFLARSDIPYPGSTAFKERIDHPSLRAIMPASVRPPIPLVPAGPSEPFAEHLARIAAADPSVPPPPGRGLSAATPPLENRRTWGSFGATTGGEWRSQPFVVSRRMYLKFETAGHAGLPGVALEVHDAATRATMATLQPSRTPGDSWRAAYAAVPAGRYFLAARVTDPARWLAFSEPVETAALSYWAWQAAKHGALLVWLSTALALVSIAGLRWCDRTPSDPRAPRGDRS
jgi:hypothetical protein